MVAGVTRLLPILILLLGTPVWAGSVEWRVRSLLYDTPGRCNKTATEIVLRTPSGRVAATHTVRYAEDIHDDLIQVDGDLSGNVTLELYRTDCGNVRTRIGELRTNISATVMAKQLYVLSGIRDGAILPRTFQVDTYWDSNGSLAVERDGATLTITNAGPTSIQLCDDPHSGGLSDEYLVDGEWVRSGLQSGTTNGEVIAPESALSITPTPIVIKRFIPAGAAEPTIPDAARVLVAIQPQSPTQISFEESPKTYGFLSRCDYLYVPRPLTDRDRVRRSLESEESTSN